jgi:hypothetical protein
MTIFQNLIAGSGFLQGPTGATGPAANTTITEFEYVATAGQTVFTGNDKYSNPLSYTPNGIIVTLNGSVINETDEFVATNGTSLTLVQAASVNDELNIYAFPAFNVANTYTQAQANTVFLDRTTANNIFYAKTGGQLTGNVSFTNGANLLVPVGNTAQRPAAAQGYIRYNTDLNTLESANATAWANVGSGGASSGGGGVTWIPTVQNTSFIAVKNNGYLVNTATGNVTVTLPASPTLGDNITFVDYGGRFSSNGLIFFPNGSKINANTVNVALTTSTASIGLVYTDNNKGWVAYNGFESSPIGNYNVEYLIVAGGGGGSSGYSSGAGGGGGFLTGTTPILSGTSYGIIIGSGGAGVSGSSGSWPGAKGTSGVSSSFAGIISIGGGGGAGNDSGPGLGGGSGGAGSRGGTAGPGTSGQGNPGGTSVTADSHGGGGGGGAGATGSNGTTSAGGPGGIGATSSISGTSTYYAGGGGGGTYYNGSTGNGPGGTGGTGGGGPGGKYSGGTQPGTAGGTNTGGGGGSGAGFDSPTQSFPGGAGGSGVIILRYLGPQRASGGAISISGGYTTHTFTGSGTFVA